jgi:hypothetical protein
MGLMGTKRSLAAAFLFIIAACFAARDQSNNDIVPGTYSDIERLVVAGEPTVEVEAGSTRQFELMSTVSGRFGSFRKVIASTVWSIEPRIQGVEVTDKGLVTAAAGVPDKTTFMVKAVVRIKEPWDADPGRTEVIEQTVLVFDRKINPLIGFWYQARLRPCEGRPQLYDHDGGIGELEFRADGTYSVTVRPFEAYKDYWGKYKYDAAAGTIELTVDDGNSTPMSFDRPGKLRIGADGKIEIEDISLMPAQYYVKRCGMSFVRFGSKAKFEPVTWMHKELDDFSYRDDLLDTLDDYFVRLNEDTSASGVIVIYPRTAADNTRLRRLITGRIRAKKFDAKRITIKTGETRAKTTMQTWIIPAGGEQPKISLSR